MHYKGNPRGECRGVLVTVEQMARCTTRAQQSRVSLDMDFGMMKNEEEEKMRRKERIRSDGMSLKEGGDPNIGRHQERGPHMRQSRVA